MFDLITAFAIFALVIGGRAVLSSQRSVGFTRGQKIASFFSLILYLCGASLLVWALLWRDQEALYWPRPLSSRALLESSSIMKRSTVTAFRHDKDYLLILPQVAYPGRYQTATNRAIPLAQRSHPRLLSSICNLERRMLTCWCPLAIAMVLWEKDFAREPPLILSPDCYKYVSSIATIPSNNQETLLHNIWLTKSDSACWCSLGVYQPFHVSATFMLACVFSVWVNCRHPDWRNKYSFVLEASLNTGFAMASLVQFLPSQARMSW
ncbi:hypothetical protein An04g10200 [Aspergillus niger]|uniref:Uncharacterized protein n=2 Tax=Aspergillus niger TaxID=5061 RepID=A2QKD2_ASPNC|nr:hypothetical protein An04g10200 [Aspergillus niger]CAK44801.1 hypothetical protein An04g10200 [Aspergillus niger]